MKCVCTVVKETLDSKTIRLNKNCVYVPLLSRTRSRQLRNVEIGDTVRNGTKHFTMFQSKYQTNLTYSYNGYTIRES